MLTRKHKDNIKSELVRSLNSQKEIVKIIVFGSFLNSEDPNDIDVAIYQDSNNSYLDLAMKYRKMTRNIAKQISLDIIPIRRNPADSSMLREIEAGELIYER